MCGSIYRYSLPVLLHTCLQARTHAYPPPTPTETPPPQKKKKKKKKTNGSVVWKQCDCVIRPDVA